MVFDYAVYSHKAEKHHLFWHGTSLSAQVRRGYLEACKAAAPEGFDVILAPWQRVRLGLAFCFRAFPSSEAGEDLGTVGFFWRLNPSRPQCKSCPIRLHQSSQRSVHFWLTNCCKRSMYFCKLLIYYCKMVHHSFLLGSFTMVKGWSDPECILSGSPVRWGDGGARQPSSGPAVGGAERPDLKLVWKHGWMVYELWSILMVNNH